MALDDSPSWVDLSDEDENGLADDNGLYGTGDDNAVAGADTVDPYGGIQGVPADWQGQRVESDERDHTSLPSSHAQSVSYSSQDARSKSNAGYNDPNRMQFSGGRSRQPYRQGSQRNSAPRQSRGYSGHGYPDRNYRRYSSSDERQQNQIDSRNNFSGRYDEKPNEPGNRQYMSQRQPKWSLDEPTLNERGESWRSMPTTKAPVDAQRASHGHTQTYANENRQRSGSFRQTSRPGQGIVEKLNGRNGRVRIISEPRLRSLSFSLDSSSSQSINVGSFVTLSLMNQSRDKAVVSQLHLIGNSEMVYDEISPTQRGVLGVVVRETYCPSASNKSLKTSNERASFNHTCLIESFISEKYWTGRIKLLTESEIDSMLEIVPNKVKDIDADGSQVFVFSERDISFKGVLQRGDIVRFDVAKELATSRIHAHSIDLVEPFYDRLDSIFKRLAKVSDERQVGRISRFALESKDFRDMGKITWKCNDQPLYFYHRFLDDNLKQRLSQALSSDRQSTNGHANSMSRDWRGTDKKEDDVTAPLTIGTGLEFNVCAHPVLENTFVAINLKLASLDAMESCVKSAVKARVIDILPHERKSHGKRNQVSNHDFTSGTVELLEPMSSDIALPDSQKLSNENGMLVLGFTRDDVVLHSPQIRVNDIVQLDIHMMMPLGTLVARALQLILPCEEEARLKMSPAEVCKTKFKRETGVVVQVSDTHCMIKCYDRPEKVLFWSEGIVRIRELADAVESYSKRIPVISPLNISNNDLVSFEVTKETCNFRQVHSSQRIEDEAHSSMRKKSDYSGRYKVASRVLKVSDECNIIPLDQGILGIVKSIPYEEDSTEHSRGVERHSRRHGKSRVKMHHGEIVIQSVPQYLIAPELWETLKNFKRTVSRFVLNNKDNAGSVENPVTALELVEVASKHLNTKGSNRSGTAKNSKKKSDNSTESNETGRKTINCDYRAFSVASDYCIWLGLKSQLLHNSSEPSKLLVTCWNVPRQVENSVNVSMRNHPKEEDKDLLEQLVNVPNPLALFTEPLIGGRTARVGDKVQFDLKFDKSTCRHIASDFNFSETPLDPIAKQFNGTDSGFVYKAGKDWRIRSFNHDDPVAFSNPEDCMILCAPPEVGDEVEFHFIQANGDSSCRASKIRTLPPGFSVLEEAIVDAAGNPALFRGTVTTMARSFDSKRIRFDPVFHNEIVPRSGIGKITPLKRGRQGLNQQGKINSGDLNENSNREQSGILSGARKALSKKLQKFANGSDNTWETNKSGPEAEYLAQKVVVFGYVFGYSAKGIVISKSAADLAKHLKSSDEKNADVKHDPKVSIADEGSTIKTSVIEHPNLEFIQFKLSKTIAADVESSKAITRLYPRFLPIIGDIVEYQIFQNRVTKTYEARSVSLVSESPSAEVLQGTIKTIGARVGYVHYWTYSPYRQHYSLKFDLQGTVGSERLKEGDIVEFMVNKNERKDQKMSKAVILCLVERPVESAAAKRGPQSLNRDTVRSTGVSTGALPVQTFSVARGPDNSAGFGLGRGRNLDVVSKLRVTAKEWYPGAI